MDDISPEGYIVMIGSGLSEQMNIVSELKKKNIDALAVNCAYPCDKFVSFRDIIVPGEVSGKVNWLGQGGYYRISDNDILCSDRILLPPAQFTDYDNGTVSTLESEVEKTFIGKKPIVIPSGVYQNGYQMHPHLDMYCLFSGKEKLLLVDTWDAARHERSSISTNSICKKRIESMAVQLGITDIDGIWYDGKKDDVWWPLNAAVIPYGDRNLFILDKGSYTLKRILKKKNIPYLEFDGENETIPSGKFNCITNIVPAMHLEKALKLVNGKLEVQLL